MTLIADIRLELGPRRIRRHYPTTIAEPVPSELDLGDPIRLQLLADQGREKLANYGHFEYVVEGVVPTLVSGSLTRFEILFSDALFSTNPIRRVRWIGQSPGELPGEGDTVRRYEETEVDWDSTKPVQDRFWEERRDRIRLFGLRGNDNLSVAYYGVPTEAELLARADWRRGAIAAAMSITWDDIASKVTRDGTARIRGMTPIEDNAEGLRKNARASELEMRRFIS